jgi:c-di-GMP-binding flagellar brake protein YcgR
MTYIVHRKAGEIFTIEKQKRDNDRMQISVPVIFAYPGREKIITQQGTTFDLSKGGMGFYSEKPLQKGLELQVHLPDLWNSPKASLVRWCSMKKNNLYRVGVSFQ